MKKIILLSNNQTLNNLILNNKQSESVIIQNEEDLTKLLQHDQRDYLLVVLNQLISSDIAINLLNSSNLPIISLVSEQKNLFNLQNLPKPFHINKLLVIIENITKNSSKKQFSFKNCLIDLEGRFIRQANNGAIIREIKLTEIEIKVLDFFFNQAPQNHNKSALLQTVWNHKNSDQMTYTGIAEVTINKLRKKLKELQLDDAIDLNID